jgi:hypothetical protein
MKTAMQELIDNLDNTLVKSIFERLEKDGLFNKALEKEKEQIICSYIANRYVNAGGYPTRRDIAEDYYNETYNQNK